MHHDSVADDSLQEQQTPEHFHWVNFLKQRWPSAVAIALWALSLGGGDALGILAEIFLLLPLLYLIVAAMLRPQASWIVLVGLTTAFFVLEALDIAAPSSVFVIATLIVLVWGAIRGQLQSPGWFRVQALGMIGFGAIALIGLTVDSNLGRYLVAAGWFLHGIWDFFHLQAKKVVAPSYAEWCGLCRNSFLITVATKNPYNKRISPSLEIIVAPDAEHA